MQRIFSLYDWNRLAVGEQATIETTIEHQRAVRLKVNAPAPMALFVRQDDLPEEMFLAHVVGLDEIEFHVQGNYTLIPTGGEVWFDTLDGSDPSVSPVEPASFTQIVERQVRNPEIELMERKMQENIERRMSAMYAGMTATLAQKDAEIEAARKAALAAVPTERASDDAATGSVDDAADAGNGGTADAE